MKKGSSHSEGAKAKMSAARKGTKWSDEARVAQSNRLKGRKFSDEHRANIAAGVKKSWNGKRKDDQPVDGEQ